MLSLFFPAADKKSARIFFEVHGQTLANLEFSDSLQSEQKDYPAGCKLESEAAWGKLMANIGNAIGDGLHII